MNPTVINYVQTTASTWRTTLAFDLAPGIELHVEVIDDGHDPMVDDAWIDSSEVPTSALLEDLARPQLEDLGERSEGWPEWMERAWAGLQEAA